MQMILLCLLEVKHCTLVMQQDWEIDFYKSLDILNFAREKMNGPHTTHHRLHIDRDTNSHEINQTNDNN